MEKRNIGSYEDLADRTGLTLDIVQGILQEEKGIDPRCGGEIIIGVWKIGGVNVENAGGTRFP